MMTPQAELLIGAQREALADLDPEAALDTLEAIQRAAIAEGFCPMCGYRLIHSTCYNPAFCGLSGGGVWWTKDGRAYQVSARRSPGLDTVAPIP